MVTEVRPDSEVAADTTAWRTAKIKAAIAFVVSRLCVLAGAAIIAAQQVVAINDANGERPSNAAKLIVRVLTSWDGKWYIRIVTSGYPHDVPGGITYDDLPARAAFFPVFPRVVGIFDTVLPGGPVVAGLLINLVASALTVLLVGMIARRVWGVAVAERSMILTSLFPGSFVLSFFYSEAILLALAGWCLLLLLDERWLAAGCVGALATATRPNGVALAAACAVAAFVAIRERREWMALIAPVLASTGFVAFQLFLWHHTGEPGVWFRVQREAWREGASFGGTALKGTFEFLTKPLSSPTDALTALSLLATGLLLTAAWKRRLPLPLFVYSAVVLFLMVLPATVTARPRFVFTAFPLLIAFAKWREHDEPDRWALIYTLCGAGLVTLTAIYGVRGAIP